VTTIKTPDLSSHVCFHEQDHLTLIPCILFLKVEDLEASVGPFLLSAEVAGGDDEVLALCRQLSSALEEAFGGRGERE
jgi:hypothetical protein